MGNQRGRLRFLWTCLERVLDFWGNWDDFLPVAKFKYNNSFQASISMALYKALYGRPCRSPVCWIEAGEALLLGPQLV